MQRKKLRAIDLYSGVGGWSLGLRMAGIDVVCSFDHWAIANETNFKNNHHSAQTVDIRNMSTADLPDSIDIVVGSPPCKEFSYSNRGGNGDIADGLKDIRKFLAIVDFLKPAFWMMENVPRVAKLFLKEIQPDGELGEFSHLGAIVHVINLEAHGLPQRRKRSFIGNVDLSELSELSSSELKRTLGQAVKALRSKGKVVDPIYGIEFPASDLHDHLTEDFLTNEEIRINKSAKVCHPVYNSMSFPDPLDKSVRTITATCTRVSRESIVVKRGNAEKYRRLTVRERASLQGFPLDFQFYGKTYSQKIKMVGNAVPPLITYYIAHAMLGTSVDGIKPLSEAILAFSPPELKPDVTKPRTPIKSYRWIRTFRFAVPSLRLKSGVRFEIYNLPHENEVYWSMQFVFGSSKSIHHITPNRGLADLVETGLPSELTSSIICELDKLRDWLSNADIAHMQDQWSHKGPGATPPFMVLDITDECAASVQSIFTVWGQDVTDIIERILVGAFPNDHNDLVGVEKLKKNGHLILSGILVGAVLNIELANRPSTRHGRVIGTSQRAKVQ